MIDFRSIAQPHNLLNIIIDVLVQLLNYYNTFYHNVQHTTTPFKGINVSIFAQLGLNEADMNKCSSILIY